MIVLETHWLDAGTRIEHQKTYGGLRYSLISWDGTSQYISDSQVQNLKQRWPPATCHDLKTWPEFFEAVRNNLKNFEVRLNDKDFRVGDYLLLKEWRPSDLSYTGRELTRRVGYVLNSSAFGIEPGYVVMELQMVSGRD